MSKKTTMVRAAVTVSRVRRARSWHATIEATLTLDGGGVFYCQSLASLAAKERLSR